MPRPRPCLVCGKLTLLGARCEDHQIQRATTSQRGYGYAHQRERARLLATYDPADPCPTCGEPLGADPSQLDLGHATGRGTWLGLEHRRCNRGHNRKDRP